MISRRNFLMLSARTLKKSTVEKVLKIGSTCAQTIHFPEGRHYLVKETIIIESNNTLIDFNGAHLMWVGDDNKPMIKILNKVRNVGLKKGNFYLGGPIFEVS